MTKVSPRRTRPQNASKHPGLPVLEAQIQRRTKAKKAEDDRIFQEAQEAREKAAAQGLQLLATMEAEMEEVEAKCLERMPKPVKPRPRPRPVKKHITPPTGTADAGQLMEVEGTGPSKSAGENRQVLTIVNQGHN